MRSQNKTNFSLIIDPIYDIIDKFGVDILANDTLWNMVLGVLPSDDDDKAKALMEFSRRDSTMQKVNHVNQLTDLAEFFIQRQDYSEKNVTEFTYVIRQLSRYVFDDDQATNALTRLKDMYITFITEYFYVSVQSGKKDEALKNLKTFGKEILREDRDLRERLAEITAFKPLN